MSFEERLCFQGLWNFADREGRLRDDPKWIQIKIFPYDPQVDIEKCLVRLSQNKSTGKPFIQRYEHVGQRYIQILEWHKHQKPHKYEQDSTIPRPSNVETTSKDIGSTTSMVSQVKGNGDGELKGQREVIPSNDTADLHKNALKNQKLDCKMKLYTYLTNKGLKETEGLLKMFCSGMEAKIGCLEPEKCEGIFRDLVNKACSHPEVENPYGYIHGCITHYLKGEGYKP